MSRETVEERDKRLAEEKIRSQRIFNISKQSFVRGAALGLGFGVAVSLLGSRFSTSYRALRLPIKAAFVSMAMFGTGTFASEHALYRIARPTPDSTKEHASLLNFVLEHRLALFSSAVGVVVLATGYRIAQNSNTTGAQKFMNVRLYGQMAGLVAIAAMMGLAAARDVVPNEKRKDN